ncbi:MAG: discoidin domain-containing protein, partial [Proteobacteria bacterium]|nr:discoidin domain-containing protein [Pseudomonadota bacterium]
MQALRIALALTVALWGMVTLGSSASAAPVGDPNDPYMIAVASIQAAESSSVPSSAVATLPLVMEGSDWNLPGGYQFEGSGGFLIFDFGVVQSIRALLIQSDNNDRYLIERSLDQYSWEPLWTVPRVFSPGLRTRTVEFEQPPQARYVRVRPGAGDGYFSVAKLCAFKEIPQWWSDVKAAEPSWSPPFSFLSEGQVDVLRPVIAVLGFFFLLWVLILRFLKAAKAQMTAARAGLMVCAMLALLCWWNFFNFHFPSFVHTWDFYHYYVGGKYFPELGYTHMYECAARADIEAGYRAAALWPHQAATEALLDLVE